MRNSFITWIKEHELVKGCSHFGVLVAWISMLLVSSFPLVVWRELSSGEPSWWPWATAIVMLVLLSLTFIPTLKTIRWFIIILFVIYLMGFGGGWQWGLIPFVRVSSSWVNWTNQAPWVLSSIATHLLRLSPALVILLTLLLRGRSRKELFLTKGKINAPVEPSRLIGMKKPEPWTRIGPIFAIVFSVGTLVFLVLNVRPSADMLLSAVPLIPVSLLIAGINSFNEEFTLRAAPLSELVAAIGKRQALLITTVFFGLGHFYGIPNGILGVFLSGFLGWFLGKSLVETKGFFWAWLIHFLPDIFIFFFLSMHT